MSSADAGGAATRVVVASRYELGDLIGSGGASRVYAARDRVTGARVAVKLLELGPSSVSPRVRREVSALRLLRLPGVVALLDAGTHERAPFLVMDFVEGEPFPGRKSPIDWGTLAPVALGLLEVLARVHAAGVVHRDLKPSNVLVNGAGRATVLDFGIAWGPALGEQLTSAGAIVGTPEYLAPEQFLGLGATLLTDLYAVGVMLYESLAGRQPHVADGFLEFVELRRSKMPPPIRQLAPSVPRDVARVLDQLLAMDPHDRPQSAGEVLAALFGRTPTPDRTPTLPRLGGSEPFERLVAAAVGGRSIDVSGPIGSGRSRLVAEAAEECARRGLRVVWAWPGTSPYSSLAPVLGGFDDLAMASGAEAEAAIRGRLEASLRSGTVVCADEADRLDRWSKAVIARCRETGAILRVTDAPAPGGIVLDGLAPTDLRELFAGPDRIFHLREDAAEELWRRTGGMPARIAIEIAAWVRAGLAHREGDHVVVRRDALNRLRGGLSLGDELLLCPGSGSARSADLDELLAWIAMSWPYSTPEVIQTVTQRPRWSLDPEIETLVEDGMARRLADGRVMPLVVPLALQAWSAEQRQAAHHALARALPPGTPLRLRHLAGAGEPLELVDEALLLAPELARQGRTADAIVVLETALAAAQGANDADREAAVLTELAKACLTDVSPGAADRVLYEFGRARSRPADADLIERLLSLAREASVGNPERALEALSRMGPFDALDFELCRHVQRCRAAQRLGADRTPPLLAEMELWARATGQPRALANVDAWHGVHLTRLGHAAEAGRKHAAAALRSDHTLGRIAANINAALAFLDARLVTDAREAAEAARRMAAACRHPLYEAIAEQILRDVAYRMREATETDFDLVEAIAVVGDPVREGLVWLTESAVAWRSGRLEEALRSAGMASRAWHAASFASGTVLSRSMELLCGAAPEPGELERLAHDAAAADGAEAAVQALGVLAEVSPARARELRTIATRRATELPSADPDVWGPVLSVREATEGVRNRPAPRFAG